MSKKRRAKIPPFRVLNSENIFRKFVTKIMRSCDKNFAQLQKWLLYLNFVFCLIISFLCISQKAPFCIRELTLPAYFAKIGMLITAVGICIRIKAVLTLKKAFTLNVQISKEQQLITNGMYKFVRHPAYTGSILSLLGVSIALKNIPAILIVAICSFVCYQIRINVEEAVLQKYFKEYNLYKEKTYKLFPYIY